MARVQLAVLKMAGALIFVLVAASLSWGQITNLNTASTPVAGSGHDYMHMLNETVNPRDGSLSMRIHVNPPRGRLLSLPFAFAYDSNGAHFANAWPGYPPEWFTNTTFLSNGGWSYTSPQVSHGVYQALGQDQEGHPALCTYFSDYMFYDSAGERHSLGGLKLVDGIPICNTDPDGDHDNWIDTDDSYAGQIVPNFTLITDADGTVYTAPSTGVQHQVAGSDPSYVMYSLAQIEDRNGNTILVNDQGGGAFTYADTMGRTLLSSSGFGFSGNTVSVSGLPNPYSLQWRTASYNFTTPFVNYSPTACQSGPTLTRGTMPVVSTVTLPNQTQYSFSYESVYGLVNQITYPTGGWVRYTWGMNNTQSESMNYFAPRSPWHSPPYSSDDGKIPCYGTFQKFVVTEREVSFNGTDVALRESFSYSTNRDVNGNEVSRTTTVTTQDLLAGTTQTVVYVYGANDVQTTTNMDGNGAVLQTVAKTFGGASKNLLTSEQVTLPNGLTTKTTYLYNNSGATSGVVLTGPGQEIEKDEFGYGAGGNAGPLLRKTVTNYTLFSPTPNFPGYPSLFDRPCQVITYDGSGNRVAESDYYYDDGATGTPCGSAGTPSVTGVNGLPNLTHDEANYSASSTAPRGNLTAEVHKCFIFSSGASCQDPIIHYAYDETGQLLSKTDAVGNITNFSYADNYSDMVPPGNTNAYLTTVTYPTTSANGVGHSVAYAYAYSDGQLTVARDQNLQQTHYAYNDSLRRLTEVDYSDGGQTIYGYNDTAYTPGSNTPYTYRQDRTVDANTVTTSWTQFDGVGRTIRSAKLNGEASPNIVDDVDTCYDGLGEKIYQTYPYQGPGWLPNTYHCPPDSSAPVGDSFIYDALGRLAQVRHADNSSVNTDYSQLPVVTVTDETGKQRRNQTDALGRLLTVWEPDGNGNLSYETDYYYNTLDNLEHVVQKGNDPNSANWRQRDFQYDSLSRLTSANNPESGAMYYGYDANGNLVSKISPMPNQTGSAQIQLYYHYDELNRLVWRWNYTQSSDPVDRYWYDLGSVWGTTVHNPIGRLVLSQSDGGSNGSTGSIHSYDVMGREEFDLQYNKRGDPSVHKQFNYAYNLDSSLQSITYPSGRVVNYGYNVAQRPISAVDSNNISFATAAHYTGSGAMGYMVNGATASFGGIVATENYNLRMQPNEIHVAAGTQPPLLDLVYDYYSCGGNNGNVCAVTNTKDSARSQQFGYDALNRLIWAWTPNLNSGGGHNWSENFGYDVWGNLLQKNGYGGDTLLNVSVNTKNQVTSWTYDAAGNIVDPKPQSCPNPPPGYPNSYDGQNRLTQARAGCVTTSYDYDADGRRVKKSGSTSTLYWYGPGGALEETDLNGVLKNEYMFFGGKRVARYSAANGYSYYFSDHLGSADVVTDASGVIKEESDFYPFGGERVVTDSGIGNNYKFTDKERDPETGCDFFGARYYCNPTGRFLTPDWAAKPVAVPYANFGNPQSLNLYSYVKNNPTTFGDPDGHCSDGDTSFACRVAQSIKTNWNKAVTAVGAMLANDGQQRINYDKASQNLGTTPADSQTRKALAQETNNNLSPYGQARTRELAADPGRQEAAAARAANPETSGASANRPNPTVTEEGYATRGAGVAMIAVGVTISAKNVYDAPQGQKLETALGEVYGTIGAIGGGFLGGVAGSGLGPQGVLAGGQAGGTAGSDFMRGALHYMVHEASMDEIDAFYRSLN